MNKFAKGSVAAGAGILLLLGGAGTLAYWNSQADLNGGTIDAGALTLTADDGTWDPAISLWVPGDSASYKTTLTLEAAGDNIQGEIKLDDDSVQIDSDAADQFEVAFEQSTDATIDGNGTIDFDSTTETFTFTGPGQYEIPVEISVSFPYDTEAEQNASQNATVDLSGVSFIATQTAANGAVTTP